MTAANLVVQVMLVLTCIFRTQENPSRLDTKLTKPPQSIFVPIDVQEYVIYEGEEVEEIDVRSLQVILDNNTHYYAFVCNPDYLLALHKETHAFTLTKLPEHPSALKFIQMNQDNGAYLAIYDTNQCVSYRLDGSVLWEMEFDQTVTSIIAFGAGWVYTADNEVFELTAQGKQRKLFSLSHLSGTVSISEADEEFLLFYRSYDQEEKVEPAFETALEYLQIDWSGNITARLELLPRVWTLSFTGLDSVKYELCRLPLLPGLPDQVAEMERATLYFFQDNGMQGRTFLGMSSAYPEELLGGGLIGSEAYFASRLLGAASFGDTVITVISQEFLALNGVLSSQMYGSLLAATKTDTELLVLTKGIVKYDETQMGFVPEHTKLRLYVLTPAKK